jgi:hypothetical protein
MPGFIETVSLKRVTKTKQHSWCPEDLDTIIFNEKIFLSQTKNNYLHSSFSYWQDIYKMAASCHCFNPPHPSVYMRDISCRMHENGTNKHLRSKWLDKKISDST